jgi:selenocysteine-specific elongation factor
MKRVILGTAGHIDHGKTELIRALTGIETDRLKEEKERGISIELGFAFLDIGDQVRFGIIDVPGHERFVRQMVAGSGGVDLAALVVALDEGVMPQTVEHLDILSLLGIRKGLVVLTKLDLVDEELALLAEEDAGDLVKGTFLEGAPMVRVSARTGEGLDELRKALSDLALQTEDRPVHGLLRLPIDRVFTLKGHGTIVTGTLISGTIKVGDEIEILPGGKRSSVRSLQSHNQQEEQAFPGERAAVNLRGLEPSDLARGDVLTHPTEFTPTYIVDVRLKVLARSPMPIRNRQLMRLHHYTTEAEARVVFADREIAEPGTEIVAQVRAVSPIVPAGGDRFVLRALSPSVTLGGGVILNPRGTKLRARSAKAFMEHDWEDSGGVLETMVRGAGLDGITRSELLGLTGMSGKGLDRMLENLRNAQKLVRFDPGDDRYVHRGLVDLMHKKILSRLEAFHAQNPLKEGIPKQELRSAAGGSDKLFKKVLEMLVSGGVIVDEGNTLRSPAHKVQLKEEEKGLKEKLLSMIVKGDNAPPTVRDLTEAAGVTTQQVKAMLDLLAKEEKIVKVKEDIYFSAGFIQATKRKLTEFINKEGAITPSQFAGVTGSSRKYNIPLLEYLDRERFTIRVGDQRVLRGSGS